MVIRAQYRDTNDILEVIPQEKLQGDFPAAFVYDRVHWLNLSTSIIEIRPLEKLWEQSSENWRIDCTSGQYRMYKGRECLVDIRSPTWEMVSSCFKCIDIPTNLIVTAFPVDIPQLSQTRRLAVALPRYGLSFFVNENGDLESHDFKDMVYDNNQCVGTLFGLENQLVLSPVNHIEEELIHRCVIVPDGHLSRKQRNHHVHINIDIVSTKNTHMLPVTYHVYNVNTDLGCLSGYASWRSRLYLAHLHAQTSIDWWPDPLTGRTGIQEALYLLQSAGCRSIMALDTCHEPDFLFSQYYKLYPQISFAIGEIKYLVERDKFLRTNQSNVSSPPRRPQLDVIGAQRTAYLFPFEDLGSMPAPVDLRPPISLEREESEDLAYTTSLALHFWIVDDQSSGTVDPAKIGILNSTPARAQASPSITTSLLQETTGKELPFTLSRASNIFPPGLSIGEEDSTPQETKELPFRRWGYSNTIPLSVHEVHDLLRAATATQRFRLLFILPAIVYHQTDPRPSFLSIMVALRTQILSNGPPRCAECQPLYGFHAAEDALLNCFVNAKRYQSPRLGVVDSELTVLLDDAAYPSGRINLNPDTSNHVYYDVKKLNSDLRRLFSSCYHCRSKLGEDLTHQFPEHASEHASNPTFQVTLDELLRDRCAPKLPSPSRLRHLGPQMNRLSLSSDTDTLALNQLFSSLPINKALPFQPEYIARLHGSARYARETSRITCGVTCRPSIEELQKHYAQCRKDYLAGLTILKKELSPKNDSLGQVLHRSGQWPQVTPDALFQYLASTSSIQLPGEWKQCLLSLALLLVELLRSRRILRFAVDNLEEELSRELDNEGCDGWSAKEYPDWLLIQVQSSLPSADSC